MIKQADDNGETPLHYPVVYAVKSADTSSAMFLLSTGADHLAANHGGDSVCTTRAREKSGRKNAP